MLLVMVSHLMTLLLVDAAGNIVIDELLQYCNFWCCAPRLKVFRFVIMESAPNKLTFICVELIASS